MTTIQDLLKLRQAINNEATARPELSAMVDKIIAAFETDKANTAINTLSYTERLALVTIYPGDNIEETKIFLSRDIAEKLGITRSVIVNCLRKSEALRLIAMQSLGIKGTLIKIIDLDVFKFVIAAIRATLPELPGKT